MLKRNGVTGKPAITVPVVCHIYKERPRGEPKCQSDGSVSGRTTRELDYGCLTAPLSNCAPVLVSNDFGEDKCISEMCCFEANHLDWTGPLLMLIRKMEQAVENDIMGKSRELNYHKGNVSEVSQK